MNTLKQPIEVQTRPDAGLTAQSGPGGAILRLHANDIEIQADLDHQQTLELAAALRHSAGVYTGDNVLISLFQQPTIQL